VLVAVSSTLGVGCGLLTGLSEDRTYDLVEDANAPRFDGGVFDAADAPRDVTPDVVCRPPDFDDVRSDCDACLAQNCCAAAMECKPIGGCENLVACIQRNCRVGSGIACPRALCGLNQASPGIDIAVCAVTLCDNACGRR
jgi:hypothetical protein